MSDKPYTTYVAQITLSLPGKGDTASVVVTLAPADIVQLGKETKPLSECTLAELSAYSEALEAEVWDTYEEISLLDLQERSAIDIHVAALEEGGEAGEEVEDWLNHVIISPVTPTIKKPEPGTQSKADDTANRDSGKDENLAASVAEEVVQAEVKAAIEPEITLIKPAAKPPKQEKPAPQPAPEPEAEPTFEPEPKPARIIPSQARVRVAGGRLPLAESGGAAADILLDEAPLRAMQAHALSSLDREVAGVLVGHQPEKQPDGRYLVHIIDSIVAKHTVMQGASVTYTPESWRYMTDTLQERYPDESAVIVGWYHTHPGFGIFLSGMDLFIHQNFFTQIWHVAYVLDPRARTSGFFCWNRQKTKVNRYDFLWPDWAQGSW